jgi:tetratricopeptide (TPR) repeat protein
VGLQGQARPGHGWPGQPGLAWPGLARPWPGQAVKFIQCQSCAFLFARLRKGWAAYWFHEMKKKQVQSPPAPVKPLKQATGFASLDSPPTVQTPPAPVKRAGFERLGFPALLLPIIIAFVAGFVVREVAEKLSPWFVAPPASIASAHNESSGPASSRPLPIQVPESALSSSGAEADILQSVVLPTPTADTAPFLAPVHSTPTEEIQPAVQAPESAPPHAPVLLPQLALPDARFAPNAATSALELALRGSESASDLTQLADLLSKTRNFKKAAQLRQQILDRQLKAHAVTASEFVLSSAAIALDLQSAMQYQEALAVLAQVPLDKLDATSKAIVLRMESDIHACTGDAITALARFEESRALVRSSKKGPSESASDELLHGACLPILRLYDTSALQLLNIALAAGSLILCLQLTFSSVSCEGSVPPAPRHHLRRLPPPSKPRQQKRRGSCWRKVRGLIRSSCRAL